MSRPGPGRARKRLRSPLVFVCSSYLLLSVIAHLNAWRGGAAEKIQLGGGDLATYLWGLGWVAHAVSNGESPFFTDYSNYPAGVNLLNNTNSSLLALLATPVTLAWGSVATYNLLQTLAFPCSALAAYSLLRRWTSWWPAAFVGGLLYGFSPFMVAAGWAHLFLIFAPMPPLIVLCLDEIVVRQEGSPRRWGVLLGLLVVAQFFISSEMLANTAELCILGVLLLAVGCRDRVRDKFRHAAIGLLTATGLAAVILAYPIWFTLYGPQHVRVEFPPDVVSSDLLAPVVPNSNLVLTPESVRDLGDSFSGPIAFMGRTYVISGVGYLGIPLLLVLLAVVVRHRHLVLVRLFAVMTAVAFVASLGPTLKVGTELTRIKLPGWILTKLPVLEGTVTYRYALFVPLGAAVLLAVGFDRLHDDAAAPSAPRVRRILPAAVSVAVLAPLVPSFPYSVMEVRAPDYFRRGVPEDVPTGSVLVSYPFPGPLNAETMAWQAHNDFRYRIVGGYQNVPDGRGGFSHEGNLSVTRDVLTDLFLGNPLPPLTPTFRRSIARDLADWDAATVVVDLGLPGSDGAVELFTEVLGRLPEYEQDVAVWYDLPFHAPTQRPRRGA